MNGFGARGPGEVSTRFQHTTRGPIVFAESLCFSARFVPAIVPLHLTLHAFFIRFAFRFLLADFLRPGVLLRFCDNELPSKLKIVPEPVRIRQVGRAVVHYEGDNVLEYAHKRKSLRAEDGHGKFPTDPPEPIWRRVWRSHTACPIPVHAEPRYSAITSSVQGEPRHASVGLVRRQMEDKRAGR